MKRASELALYGQIQINGGETELVAKSDISTQLQHIARKLHGTDASGFSSITIRLSPKDLKPLAAEQVDTSNVESLVRASFDGEIPAATDEEQAAIDEMLANQFTGQFHLWARAAHNERVRQSMAPGEWSGLCDIVKATWPLQYESLRHLFNG